MSDATARMFDAAGRATPYLLGRWRAKGAEQALQARAIYVRQGFAETTLRGLWRTAFPLRQALPTLPIATPEGRFTDVMLSVWLD